MSKICVHVFFTAKEGQEALAAKRLTWLQDRSRKDPGCIQYDMHVSPDDPARFMLFELWESKAHLDGHLAMEYLAGFREETQDFLATEPEITLWNKI